MTLRLLGILAAASWISSSLALPTISTVGSKFFTSDGNQFFVKGIAYQLTQDDPLLDPTQCEQDATLMQTLGTNSIRVYHVDPTQDHSACMKVFEAAGIYLWLDLDTFDTQLTQISPQWTNTQFAAFSAVMDSFQSFDNLAGFWIGNEVLTQAAYSESASYIKAATHDMKAYRMSKGYRNFPIGYSAADILELRPMLQNYLACGDESSSIEFFGLNAYEWCGDATYDTSGYSNLQAMSSGYSIPIFFSETGCNTVKPRTFADQAAIFGPDMVETWSGSMIYEWIEEVNDYGLISYGAPDSEAKSGTPTPIEPDFSNLKTQWENISTVGISKADYTPSLAAPACPSSTPGGWLIDGNPSVPTLLGSVGSQASSTPSSTSAIVPSTTSVGSEITSEPSSATLISSPPVPSGSAGPMSSSLPVLISSLQSTSMVSSAPSVFPPTTTVIDASSSTTLVSSSNSITPNSFTSISSLHTGVDTTDITLTASSSTSEAQLSTSDTPLPTTANETPTPSASPTTTAQKSIGSRIGLDMFFLTCIAIFSILR